ncbi:hypothetical protein ACFQ3J_15275 [Paenibacillus provencensis]|uniref:Uncharacterized protein n=1 Tax=Paenibacillus provencensis TaxID=441151 RepID=A0ABW3PY40_9BACL|nr:hypothetical protein [Paenibacillus sp. MER 78]
MAALYYGMFIFAEILKAMPSASVQLDFAIEHMGEHVEKYSQNSWLLFHSSVAKLSFEELVGTEGGGYGSQGFQAQEINACK